MIIEFFKNPTNTGSVMPSSRFLVNEMVSHISKEGAVIELGSGTGVITRKLAAMQSVNSIYAYENNEVFHDSLRCIDKTICLSDFFEMEVEHENKKVNTIVSSIPFVNFSMENRKKALNIISKTLNDEGQFIQYTYLNRCPFGTDALHENNFKVKQIKKIWLNIPPATVYVYEKIALK